MSSTTTSHNRSLLLLLFFFFLQNFDSSAQENVQLTGFNCTFISTDGVSAFPCATKVTATITLPNNNLVTSVNLVFPNSFCVNGISAEGGGNPNFTNLGQTSIGNITVPDGQLMNLAISPTAQPIIVEFEYKNFNVYNANGQVNTNFLLFDCSGTGNNITYLSNLNGSNLQTIPDDWGFVQLNHNSNAPISLVHGSMGNESMNPGESYIRTFFVDIFSLSVDEFWLTITDEVDAILSNTVIYKDGQVNLPLIYDSGTPANVFNFQNYIVPGPNGARRLQFSHTVILDCNNNNPQITTVKAGLTCYCNSANSSVNFYTPITLNGTAGVMPNLSIEGQSFTSNVAENECTTFTLEIPFTVTGSALYASLENIHIPLSQIWAENISSIAVIAGEYSTSINSNYTSDNGGLSIVFSTLSSTLQGFQPSINSTTGQWFNSSFKLQIVFNNPLTSSSSSCNGLPALQLYANNTLSINLKTSCSTSIQNTYSLNPVTAHVTPVVLTTTNSDTDLAYYSENDQHANLVFDVYNLTTMPITMYSNSNPQPLCGNIDYSLVVEIAEFGVPLTLDFISELSINNVSVANATIENGNLIVPLSTLSASNEPNLQKVKFKLQYSGVCPDGTEDNNFGSYIIKAQIRAECPDCDNATLILKCAEHELFVHCPGTCESAVHIDKNIQARRITLGFEGLSQFNQNFPLTELSGNLNEDEKKNELTKVYPFDLVEIITQGEVYHQNTNDNSLYSMTQVGFELSVSDVFGNGDNDFLSIHQVNAVFTNLQNQSLIFTLPENAYSFIGWQSEAVPGISQSMKIGRLFFTLPSEISLSEDSWKIDLILVLRVGALPELAPNYYPVSFRCQYIATKPGGGYHTSCDPYGFNLMVLKTAVISANSSVAIVAPDNPNNRSFVLPHILGNAIDNLPALSSCEADGVVGYRIIGGFNGAISDFEHEFRPVIGWPNSGYIEGLAEVKGIYSDQSEFVLQSEPGNFARTSNTAIQDARANILGTQGYQGFYYKINKPCAFGNSNSTVPLNVTLDINAHAYIHDGFQLSALPPALPAPNLTYVPNMNNLDWNPNFNSTYNIPNFENPIAQNGTFNFNLKMPAGLGNKPMFLFFSISDFVGNSPPTIGTPTIAGFELHSSITNLFISNEGISDVDYTSFSIPINVNCFPSAFNINVAWGISCDPDYNFFSIANIGEILPLPGITTTCPNNFATRSFRFKHINNPFAETNNLVADNETCELVWTLNFTNPINNSPAVFNEFNLNFFTGLLYTEAVVSYTEPGNSNPNQPTLNPPAFNVTLPGGSITTQPLVYTTLSLNPSEFTIAPGATISYVLRFKLSEDVCANFNDYLPNNFLSFFSWQTNCQPPTNGPITVINKPILLELVSQIINQATNPDCCVPVPITYELKPNCNASEWPFNGELTLNMADPCTSAYHYRLIRTINDATVEEEQGHLGGSDPCSATISNLAHGTYGLIYFNSEAGWYFVQTITIGDIQLVASFQESSISFCQGENITLAPIIQTNSNTSSLSYQWSLNGEAIQNQTTATLENPSQSGNYFFTVSNGTCVATADIMVTVNPLPVISPAGSYTFCESGTLSVSDGTAPYTWSNSQTGVNLTVNASGTFNVTDANGCSATANTTVTVNPLPDASITANGPTTFCQGGSVTLNGPTGAGLTYLWSNGATNQNINVNTSGDFTLTVTNANGCTATSAAIQVTMNSNPTITITGVTTICAGQNTTLTATPIPANAAIQWTNGPATQTFTVSQAGTYNVTATLNGCSSSADFELSLFPQTQVFILPEVSSIVVCDGSEVDLESSESSGIMWSNGNYSQTISVSAEGTYTLTYTDPNGCISTASIDVVADPDVLCACPDCPNTALEPLTVTSEIASASALINHLGGMNISDYCIKMNHDFIVDQAINFINCDIIVAPGKTIKNFNRLTFNNTQIMGCEKLWQGIENYNALSISNNSVVQDAVYAIQTFVNIENNSSYTNVINSTLKNNFIGIFNITEFSSNISISVTNSIFTGGAILSPYQNQTVVSGTKSFAGIVLNNGIVFTNFKSNHFNKLCIGVLNNNSTIVSYYNTFEDIQNFEPGIYIGNNYYMETVQGAGVGFYSINNANTTIYGLGNEVDSAPTFYNTHVGVFNFASDLNIENCKFDYTNNQTQKGIYVFNPINTIPSRLIVFQNRINATHESIFLNQTDQLLFADIRENTIVMNFTLAFPARYGIRVENYSSAGKITISKNNINIQNTFITSVPMFGIYANTAQQIRIVDNNIDLKGYRGRGISLTNSSNSRLSCNSITSTNIFNQFNLQEAIYQSMSANTRLIKNTTEGSRTGFRFLDNNTNTDLRSNFIGNHTTGILISSGIIGDQENKGNRWFGSYPVGSNKFGARTDVNNLFNNRFKVHPNSSAEFYPHYFPNYQSNCLSGDFFQCDDIFDEPMYGPCSITTPNPPSSIAAGDSEKWLEIASQMAASSLQFPVFNEEYNFYTLRDVEDAINNGWVHLADTGIFIPFKAMLAESAARKLNAAEQRVRGSLPDSAIASQIELFRIDWQELRILVGEIDEQYAANPADTSLIAARNTLVNQMNIIQQQINLIRQGVLQVQGYARDSTFNYLGGLVTPQEYAEYDRVVSQLYLSTIAQGNFSFSESDSITLYNIASLCPALGGKAVYKARSLYTLLNDSIYFDDDSLCVSQSVMFREQESNTLHQTFELQAKVYPNPTNGQVRVDFNFTPEQFIVFKLYDGTGKLLGNKTITSKEFEFSIKELTNESGLYFYELSDTNSKFRQTGKISFIK